LLRRGTAREGAAAVSVYLIDGYNVLHQFLGHHRGPNRSVRSPSDRKLHGHDYGGAEGESRPSSQPGAVDLEDERRRLLDRIASYMGGTVDRAIVVFDSHSQVLQKTESATRNVDVYFGSFSRSADSIIEREVYALSAGETVVVVSSDYQLQKTIFLPNVIRRSSRQFVADLQEHTKRIANPGNCITMSHRIEERVDPETVERLKALRDELSGQPEEPSPPEQGSET
jgi:predicted RNA-binding protein with PIN domain